MIERILDWYVRTMMALDRITHPIETAWWELCVSQGLDPCDPTQPLPTPHEENNHV